MASDSPPPAVSTDELLPPVEPPSAAFILQLFVIPAVIVAAVVGLWLLVETLARGEEQDADAIVRALGAANQARFQQAANLADMLRLPERYPKVKVDRELAQKLAALLEKYVAAGDSAEGAVTMRIFLVTALGEFHVDDGLPALITAARDDKERDVRRRAINAIAVLGDALAKLAPPQQLAHDELTPTLLEFAADTDELIRSETAFALGVLAAAPGADPALTDALVELADDPYTDARFNAGAGLARRGHPRAAASIAEMLDPAAIDASLAGERALNEEVTAEALRAQKAYKRNTILNSALASLDRLLAKGALPVASRAALEQALQKFLAAAPSINDPAPVPRALTAAAQEALARVHSAAAPIRAGQ